MKVFEFVLCEHCEDGLVANWNANSDVKICQGDLIFKVEACCVAGVAGLVGR